MAGSLLSPKPAGGSNPSNTRFVSRPMQRQEESLGDLTFYEAEHIPLKVVMKPLSTNPRIRLDLKLIAQKQAYKQSKPDRLLRTGHTAAVGKDKILRLHARAASDIIISAGYSQTPLHSTCKTLIKPILPFGTSKQLLNRSKKPLTIHFLATKSPTHLTFKAVPRLR